MRTLTATMLLVLAAGCAMPRVPQPPIPPERAPNSGRIAPDARTPTNEAATERWLEEQTTFVDPRTRIRGMTPTNEAATEQWLTEEIERRRYVPPEPPPQQIVERVVIETPQYGYQPYQEPYRRTSFPFYTASGAGLGAAIGAASDSAGEGAAIGAGVGLFLDLVSWR